MTKINIDVRSSKIYTRLSKKSSQDILLTTPPEPNTSIATKLSIMGWVFNLLQILHLNVYCQTPVLGLGPGVDFTFAWENNNNDNNNDNKNPHLNFLKGTVLGDKEQGVGIIIRDKGLMIKDKT